MRLRHEILLLGWTAVSLTACSATRQVETVPKSDVLVLTPTYSIQENLGSAPIQVTSHENLVRYRLQRKQKAPEFLLVLFPDKMEGSLPIKLAEGAQASETAVRGTYFDQLLRAHRLVLKGDLEGAASLISRMQSQYDDGYGTSVLAGNVALLKGEHDTAIRQFLFAKSLIPSAPVPKDLAPTEGAAP